MANPSVTYTFTNGTTADGSQVSQNFADLIAGMTDGTKSFSIDALTVAGAALFNGAVTLGNASSDDITHTGSLASSIPIKTDSSYDLGDSTHAMRVIYSDKIQGGSTAGCEIVGRTDNVAPSAGMIGAKISGSLLSVTYSNATPVDIGSIVLTAGTWIVFGKGYTAAAGTTQTLFEMSLSTTSNTINDKTRLRDRSSGVTEGRFLASHPMYITTSGQTVYLVASVTFTGTAPSSNDTLAELYAVRVA